MGPNGVRDLGETTAVGPSLAEAPVVVVLLEELLFEEDLPLDEDLLLEEDVDFPDALESADEFALLLLPEEELDLLEELEADLAPADVDTEQLQPGAPTATRVITAN